MTKFLTSIACFILLFSCGEEEKILEKKQEIPDVVIVKDTVDPETVLDTSALNLYQRGLKKLATTNYKNLTLAATYFDKWFKGKNAYSCDSAFILFENFSVKVLAKLDESELEKYNSDENGKWPDELNELNKEYKKYGFEITETEGILLFQIYAAFVNKTFHHRVSNGVQKILELERNESENWTVHDAGLSIETSELVDRFEAWSTLRDSTFQCKSFNNRVKDSQKYYRTILLSNFLDNTYIYYPEQDEIDPSYRQGYEYWKKKYPYSKHRKKYATYVQFLMEGKFQSAQEEFKKFPKKDFIRYE